MQTIGHYENFPVASVLCPPRLRPAITAIYHFARTADDIADEGPISAAARLSDLRRYRWDLRAIYCGQCGSGRWPQVFGPLRQVIHDFGLPQALMEALLSAFMQDVGYTHRRRRYATDSELLDYCRRSANPVGRLLLHLYGVTDACLLAQSDQICTALQLINFWQDVQGDIARGRWYLTRQAMAQFAVQDADLQPGSHSPRAAAMIAHHVATARAMMQSGAPLARRVPGRAGYELRLVVQGGLRILDKIAALQYATWQTRPRLAWWDWPVMLWRAVRM